MNVAVNSHKISEQEKEQKAIEIMKQMKSLKEQWNVLAAKHTSFKQEEDKIKRDCEDLKKQVNSMGNKSEK